MHPLSVKGSKSENRWSQTRHEIFSPLPCKVIAVAPSGGGKSSLLLTFANAVFENMDYWAIFSRPHMLDPALQDLKARIRERYKKRGVDEQSTPFLFENLDSLTRVLAEQKQRVQELKEAEPPVTRLPQLFVMIDDIGLEATRFSRVLDNAFANSRHYGTNLACGSQLFKSLSKSIRVNADILCCHRLPAAEYESVEAEVVGTWVNKAELRELYEFAVSAHSHGFLTIKLKAKNPHKMFAADFSRWLHPT